MVTFDNADMDYAHIVREHDTCIMDIASAMYEGKLLRQIHLCRISMQVIFPSDIAAVDGQRILWGTGVLSGEVT